MTVTIPVPAPAPAVIAAPPGSVAGAEAFAERVTTAARRYAEVGDAGHRWRQVPGWWGEAADAYARAAGAAADEYAQAASILTRAGRAVWAYADILAGLVRAHEDLVGRKQALDRRREQLLAEIEATPGANPHVLTRLETDAAELHQDYERLGSDHDRWQRQVGDNEDRMRRALAQAVPQRDPSPVHSGTRDAARDAMARPGAPGSGAAPGRLRAWWDGLAPTARAAVIAAYPAIIGTADGLPAAARDEANRLLLADDLATLGAKEDQGTLGEHERQVLADARRTEQALATAGGFTDPLTGEHPGGQLWLYEPAAFGGEGRVAVAVGDLDTAADVAVRTPGVTTETTDVASLTAEAAHVYEAARHEGDGSRVASMAWLGYDAPDGPADVATYTEARAETGGARLAEAVEGLREARGGDPAHLTVIGTSYGSTTVSYAAAGDLPADDVVLLGSPGAGPAEEASDFSVGADHTWVGRNSRDPIALLGDEGAAGKLGLGLGTDPSSQGFGATRFEAEDPGRGWYSTLDQHGGYVDTDSESLYNVGRIVDGQPDEVNQAPPSEDPWYGLPMDPEWERGPTSAVPGRSQTTAGG